MSRSDHDDDAAAATAAAAATTIIKDDVDPKSDLQRRRRFGLLVFSVLYSVLYVGALFGWGVSRCVASASKSHLDPCSTKGCVWHVLTVVF
jgi:hypothetical protein